MIGGRPVLASTSALKPLIQVTMAVWDSP